MNIEVTYLCFPFFFLPQWPVLPDIQHFNVSTSFNSVGSQLFNFHFGISLVKKLFGDELGVGYELLHG